MNNIRKDIQYCKGFLQKYGKSYYFAAQFFPQELRSATYALYAFVRVPDEYVDNEDNSRKKLQKYKMDWIKAYRNKRSENPVLNATSYIFHKYNIPFEYSLAFIKAMETDITKQRYQNFQELKEYMYGSAAVVGLMMSYIIGFKNPVTLKYAADLGYAMQLTNFIRDIGEDYVERQRIYLPQTELRRFGLSEQHFAEKRVDAAFVRLMKFNIKRAEAYYNSARKGIKFLDPAGQRAVNTALVLYRSILGKIIKNNYDVFNKRAYTNIIEKIILAIGGVFSG